MSNVMSDLFYTYLNLYRISIVISVIILWMTLSYVDRIHFRERAGRIGIWFSNILSHLMIKQSFYDKFRICIVRPMCVICDTVAGFLEGIENLEAIVLIAENNDQMLKNISIIEPKLNKLNKLDNLNQNQFVQITTKINSENNKDNISYAKEHSLDMHMKNSKNIDVVADPHKELEHELIDSKLASEYKSHIQNELHDIDDPFDEPFKEQSEDEKSDDLCNGKTIPKLQNSPIMGPIMTMELLDDNYNKFSRSSKELNTNSKQSSEKSSESSSDTKHVTKDKSDDDSRSYDSSNRTRRKRKIPIRLARRKHQYS